ncbi:dephospho-CoA kinase [Flavobacterium cheonhonense]|jgi:dephospho-CoA kinase|uniref:Dephospho-CoA kinase n=1 Tax=Flavobacterium cheonhonense TaxID=706185 RepID=A0ABP7TLR3_9FLAO|nr:dephospho-CoA kinase [Flavobacterium cheonhonense]PJE44454.1 MAG: dephospho-CoA kinase [Flavobacterium sp.] [Flavobacterium sp. FEMGT703F]
MTKIIGLTGGIGSGKTTVARYIAAQGIPVYIADEEAKKVMNTPEVLSLVAKTFGDSVIEKGVINRQKLAQLVFNAPEKLQELNNIIHPKVKQDFENWVKKHHNHPFVIKEAAILFESGSYQFCDKIITVTAPENVRIQRVMQRDSVTEDQVLARMQNQWKEDEKIALSDYVIQNVNIEHTKIQVDNILKTLKKNQ